jgi:hypothetical protein
MSLARICLLLTSVLTTIIIAGCGADSSKKNKGLDIPKAAEK